jgi:hypothetical protein
MIELFVAIGYQLDLLNFVNLLCICKEIYEKRNSSFKLWVIQKLFSLQYLHNKSQQESPYNYYKKNVHIVIKQLLYLALTGNNFIKTFGPRSGLSRYRQHVLNHHVILPLLSNKYIEKTIHCSKQIINDGYESDEYIDGEWIYIDTGSVYDFIPTHYVMIVKDKHYHNK